MQIKKVWSMTNSHEKFICSSKVKAGINTMCFTQVIVDQTDHKIWSSAYLLPDVNGKFCKSTGITTRTMSIHPRQEPIT